MEFQQLRYVITLAQELHFGRAARRMNVTQPSLSQQIKKLEDELRCSLFERDAHCVRLTDAGVKFIEHARGIIDQAARAILEVQQDADEIEGRIRVGVIPTICPYLLPPLISYLRRRAPKLSMEIYESTTSELLIALKKGTCDLGLLSLPIREDGIVNRSIGTEKFFAAISRLHPLSEKKRISPAQLQKEAMLILKEGHCFSEQALSFCKFRRDHDRVIFQGSSLTSVLKLAERNEGITLVPAMAARAKSYPGLKFIPFVSPEPRREIGVSWRISMPLSLRHQFFMDSLGKIFHSH